MALNTENRFQALKLPPQSCIFLDGFPSLLSTQAASADSQSLQLERFPSPLFGCGPMRLCRTLEGLSHFAVDGLPHSCHFFRSSTIEAPVADKASCFAQPSPTRQVRPRCCPSLPTSHSFQAALMPAHSVETRSAFTPCYASARFEHSFECVVLFHMLSDLPDQVCVDTAEQRLWVQWTVRAHAQ